VKKFFIQVIIKILHYSRPLAIWLKASFSVYPKLCNLQVSYSFPALSSEISICFFFEKCICFNKGNISYAHGAPINICIF
jgi:hypothetical protein